MNSDDNVVVSAPTGAGKTAVFDMAIARFLTTDLEETLTLRVKDQPNQSSRSQISAKISSRRKMVYISPSKALCEERYEDWTRRLSSMNLGIEVASVTGDGDPGESFRELAACHLVLTTPEKVGCGSSLACDQVPQGQA